MRRRLGGYLVEDFAHLGVLVLGPLANGGPAADLGVLLLDLRGPALGEKGPDIRLEAAEGDQIAIGLSLLAGRPCMGRTEIRTNSRLRKSPTSPVVEGPPMLRNTIAVGPLDPVASCVTGGTWVASVRECDGIRRDIAAGARVAEVSPRAKLSGSFVQGCRKDIGVTEKGKASSNTSSEGTD